MPVGSGYPTEPTPFHSTQTILRAPKACMSQKAGSCPHPGLAIWMPIQQLVKEAASSSSLSPPSSSSNPVRFSRPSLSPPRHATIFCLSSLLCPKPPAPNQIELRNRLLAQQQLLSKCFLIVCIEGELGTALAPVMEPSSSCLGWPNPPSPPLSWPPWPWRFRFFRTYRLYPSLFSGAVKPGTTKKEGGKAGALSLLRTQPLPPPPTSPALCKRTFSPHHSPSAAPGPQSLAQLCAWG